VNSCLVPQGPQARLERYTRELILVARHGEPEHRAGFLRRYDPYLGGVAAWISGLPRTEQAQAFEDALRMQHGLWPQTVLGLRLALPPWFQRRLDAPTSAWEVLAHYQPKAIAVDPVCGMVLDPEDTEYRGVVAGRTFYFCCPHCAETHDAPPSGALASLA
jgi:YHS domain-containing protein